MHVGFWRVIFLWDDHGVCFLFIHFLSQWYKLSLLIYRLLLGFTMNMCILLVVYYFPWNRRQVNGLPVGGKWLTCRSWPPPARVDSGPEIFVVQLWWHCTQPWHHCRPLWLWLCHSLLPWTLMEKARTNVSSSETKTTKHAFDAN